MPACMDGAPWRKDTTVWATSPVIQDFRGACPGCESHIVLEGTSPDGRAWTQVACSYWPAWARQLARVWRPYKDIQPRSAMAYRSGMLPVSFDKSVEQVITMYGFASPRTATSSVAARVRSGNQPTRWVVPQLIPDGLKPAEHLQRQEYDSFMRAD